MIMYGLSTLPLIYGDIAETKKAWFADDGAEEAK
jgi:hypothetical protein